MQRTDVLNTFGMSDHCQIESLESLTDIMDSPEILALLFHFRFSVESALLE